jgi:hypothetical protein
MDISLNVWVPDSVLSGDSPFFSQGIFMFRGS